MPPRLMTPPVEVMPLLKLRSRKRASEPVVNSCLSILQVVRELRIVKVTIKIDKQKELKSTNLCLD